MRQVSGGSAGVQERAGGQLGRLTDFNITSLQGAIPHSFWPPVLPSGFLNKTNLKKENQFIR